MCGHVSEKVEREELPPSRPEQKRWAHLNVDQLLGAEYALRLVRTSPRVRGIVLMMVEDLIAQAVYEITQRDAAERP
jgi:hypothetical protein